MLKNIYAWKNNVDEKYSLSRRVKPDTITLRNNIHVGENILDGTLGGIIHALKKYSGDGKLFTQCKKY
jgi:hypothetical protein